MAANRKAAPAVPAIFTDTRDFITRYSVLAPEGGRRCDDVRPRNMDILAHVPMARYLSVPVHHRPGVIREDGSWTGCPRVRWPDVGFRYRDHGIDPVPDDG